MASPNPSAREAVRERRKNLSMDGEPLNVERRDAQQFHTSIYINVTDYGRKTHNIDKGDEVKVETHKDGIIVRPINDNE